MLCARVPDAPATIPFTSYITTALRFYHSAARACNPAGMLALSLLTAPWFWLLGFGVAVIMSACACPRPCAIFLDGHLSKPGVLHMPLQMPQKD